MRCPHPSADLLPWLTRDPEIRPWLDDPITRQIVGRIHVGASGLGVCRDVILRLKHQRRTFLRLERWKRRALCVAILARHAENRQQYQQVMGGSIGRPRRSRARTP